MSKHLSIQEIAENTLFRQVLISQRLISQSTTFIKDYSLDILQSFVYIIIPVISNY